MSFLVKDKFIYARFDPTYKTATFIDSFYAADLVLMALF